MKALVYIRTQPGKALDLAGKLKKIAGVSEVFAVTGRFDVVAVVEGEDLKTIADIVVNKIQKAGAVSTETALVVE
jgi:DNA-binding Lrp family transcriptional regulator